jgi:hypothetical protein
MAGPNITDLTEMTSTPADDDVIYIVDVSASGDRKLKYSTLIGSSTTTTSDYTITKNREKIFASGNITITLPAASNGWEVSIANVGTGSVIIQCAGSDTIEGQTSIILANQYDSVTLKSNGASLWVEF